MTAHDWLAVLALLGLLVASIGLDATRRRMEHRADPDHERLMREIRRQP